MSREINVQVCSARLLGFSSLSLSTFFLVGGVVRGTCLEQLRVPHTCPHRACPESRGRAWRPGRRPVSTSGPDSVAAFCLKERIPIPVLGDAPGEACPRHRAHHLASGVLGLALHACAAEGRCVWQPSASGTLRDTGSRQAWDAQHLNSAFWETVEPFAADVSSARQGTGKDRRFKRERARLPPRRALEAGAPVSMLSRTPSLTCNMLVFPFPQNFFPEHMVSLCQQPNGSQTQLLQVLGGRGRLGPRGRPGAVRAPCGHSERS